MSKKRFLAVLLTFAMVLSLAACGGKEEAPAEKPAETPATETPAADDGEWSLGVDTIKIGYVGPLTGTHSGMGQAAADALEVLTAEINAKGGVGGAMLEYVIRDDESDPTKSFTNVEELIYKEEIDMLIGAPNSACASASVDTTNENEIITILHTASANHLIDPEAYPYTFRILQTNDLMAEALVQMALDGGYEKVVVIGDTSALGVDGIASTQKYAEQYGLELAEAITYTAGDADLSAVANSIKNSGADCVLAWALSADAAKIVRVMDRIDYMVGECEIIGYSGMDATFAELVSDLDTSNVTYLYPAPHSLKPGAEKLGERNQVTYDLQKDSFGAWKTDGSGRTSLYGNFAWACEAIYLYCDMVERARSLDSDAIKEALETYGKDYTWKCNDIEGGMTFSPDDHEGFNPAAMARCALVDNVVNEYVDGDIPTAAK